MYLAQTAIKTQQKNYLFKSRAAADQGSSFFAVLINFFYEIERKLL